MESLSPDWQQEAILNLSLFRRRANRSKWYWRGSELKAKPNVCQGLTVSLNLARELGHRPDCASSFLHHLSASPKEPAGTKWQTRTILLESWGGARPPSGDQLPGSDLQAVRTSDASQHQAHRGPNGWRMSNGWGVAAEEGPRRQNEFPLPTGDACPSHSNRRLWVVGKIIPFSGPQVSSLLKPCPLTFI